MKKILKVLTAGMLALALTFGLMTTAVAAPDDPAAATDDAVITKVVRTPVGTTLPALMNFEFVFAPVSFNESTLPVDVAKLPVIGTNNVMTIGFNATDADIEATTGGVTIYYLESGSIFENVVFGQAGIYEWQLTENDATYSVHTEAGFIEKVEYSEAVYTFKVYVKEDGGDLVITHVGVIQTKDDAGEDVDEGEQGKTNPSPGGGSGTSYLYSQLVFTNGYEKTPEPTIPGNPDPTNRADWTFSVGKTVTGDFTGSSNVFDFNLTLTIPSLVFGDVKTCTGYFVEEVSGAYQLVAGVSPIVFTSGEVEDFTLTHGQFLVFVDAKVGTGFAVGEGAHAGFTPKVKVTYSPALGLPVSAEVAAGADESLALPRSGFNSDLLFVGEKGTEVAFTNDRGAITPMGIIMADLPIIALVLLSAAALIGLAAIRARINKEKKNAQASVSVNSHDSN
ncbi:MAG: hypothetical protein FWE41_07205 [Coriobacteriia bacterium]|nr:hypothetical protein [Coriobacteriia bacterium]MCL2750776.1 hypothetical protein [Coriobacteriia bacterium]